MMYVDMIAYCSWDIYLPQPTPPPLSIPLVIMALVFCVEATCTASSLKLSRTGA